MSAPHSEIVVKALVVALSGIRKSAGFNNDSGPVQRFSNEQQRNLKPTIILAGIREIGELQGAGYDMTVEIEVETHFYAPRGGVVSLDELSNLWKDDVHRAIANMDWGTLQVDAVRFETFPFQLQDQTSLHDGNLTQLQLTYRLEDSELRTLI